MQKLLRNLALLGGKVIEIKQRTSARRWVMKYSTKVIKVGQWRLTWAIVKKSGLLRGGQISLEILS